MSSRTRLNLLLLAVAIGLGLLVWIEPGHEPPPPPERLSGIDPESVRTVRIEVAGRAPVVVERTADGWRMRAPREMAANAWRIRALLGVLRAPVSEGFRAAGNDLSQYGLDPPLARVVADDHEVRFGTVEPLGERRYVAYGPEVWLVHDDYFQHLAGAPFAFVHPAPLGPGAVPVEIDLPGVRLVHESGGWRVVSGPAPRSADDPVALAAAWRNAMAARVDALDPDLPWREHVLVRLAGTDEPIAIEVAEHGPETLLGRRDLGLQYHFARSTARRLLTLGAPG